MALDPVTMTFILAGIVQTIGSLLSAFTAKEPEIPRSYSDKWLEDRVKRYRAIREKREKYIGMVSLAMGVDKKKIGFGGEDFMTSGEMETFVRETEIAGKGEDVEEFQILQADIREKEKKRVREEAKTGKEKRELEMIQEEAKFPSLPTETISVKEAESIFGTPEEIRAKNEARTKKLEEEKKRRELVTVNAS